MSRESDAGLLRRYVLGATNEDECDAIERDYFERADVLDQVSAAEDDLIDDYLSNRLTDEERDAFRRSLPDHAGPPPTRCRRARDQERCIHSIGRAATTACKLVEGCRDCGRSGARDCRQCLDAWLAIHADPDDG